MAENKLPNKEEVLSAINDYIRLVEDQRVSDEVVDETWLQIEQLLPHAHLSDLINWGEKKRTEEEAVEEAILRERIWQQGGDIALYHHIEAQLASALEDEALTGRQRYYCENTLANLREKMDGQERH